MSVRYISTLVLSCTAALLMIGAAVYVTQNGLFKPQSASAQFGGEQEFGGQFTTIRHFCCDGTYVLQHRAAASHLPQGAFKTTFSMDAYREMFYYPIPQTCAVGFVRPGGVCTTLESECLSSVSVDYTITTIGSSRPGCSVN